MTRTLILLVVLSALGGCEPPPPRPRWNEGFNVPYRCLPEATTEFGLVSRCLMGTRECFVYERNTGAGGISCVSR